MVGALVLGNFLEHALQALQFFLDRGRAAVFLLDLAILGREICGHLSIKLIWQLSLG